MNTKRLGRPKGPDALRRVNLACRVLPETLKALGKRGERGTNTDKAVALWLAYRGMTSGKAYTE